MRGMHGMRVIAAAAVLGTSAVGGLCAEPAPSLTPAPAPAPAVEPSAPQHGGPKAVITQVSQTPRHEVAISWEVSDLPKDATIRVQRAGAGAGAGAGNDRKFRPISRPQAHPTQSGRFVDEDNKRFNETYFYRLEIAAPKAEPIYSEAVSIDLTSNRIPAAPTHLQGKFLRIDDKHYIELTWDGPMSEASGTDHFRLFQMQDQHLALDPTITLIRRNTYRYEVTRQDEVEVTLGIAAISPKQDRSEIATVRVVVPGTFYPAPTGLAVKADLQGTTVSWKFEQSPTLAGFRIFHGDNLLLDERQVPAEAREATVKLPPGTIAEDTVWVQAVSRLGTTSWRVRPSGKGEAPAPAHPAHATPAHAASPTATAAPTSRQSRRSPVADDGFYPATPPERIDGRPRPGQMPDPWYKNHTPMMAAAVEGNGAEVARLIEAGDNVNCKCRDGLQETALMLACKNRDHGYEVAKLLVQAGADVNARFHGDSFTPLMYAVRQHSAKCVKLLIDSGAKLSLDNGHGQTALDWAREEKDEQIIRLLEQAGAK